MPSRSSLVVRSVYRHLVTLLRQRSGGQVVVGPDWVDPALVESMALALPGLRHGARVIEVALRDGFPGSALPQRLALPGSAESVPLRVVRAARATAQGAPGLTRANAPHMTGTATCLVRDMLNPLRNYLLTCGHVAAPNSSVVADELLHIDDDGHLRQGRLVEWQPALGAGVFRTRLDAALVEIAAGDAIALRRAPGFVPAGLGGAPTADMAVTLRRRRQPLPGVLKVFWSGFVDVPGLTPGDADYFLADAIGYLTDQDTEGGDSGGAIWDAAERLMGMHIAGLHASPPGRANAVFGPIAPVLDWYSVQPYLQNDPATLPAPAPRGAPAVGARLPVAPLPAVGLAADAEIAIVAATLWGEARGQGKEGMRAVAWVVANRLRRKYQGKSSCAAVCQAPFQFSCWNANDPNLPRMRRIAAAPDAPYLEACAIARELVTSGLQGKDPTNGATHYYARSLRPPAYWARGKSPCAEIGAHLFYNNID